MGRSGSRWEWFRGAFDGQDDTGHHGGVEKIRVRVSRHWESRFGPLALPSAQLRKELGTEHGTVKRVADQLGYGVESVRSWVRQADIDDGAVITEFGCRLYERLASAPSDASETGGGGLGTVVINS